MPHKQHSLSLWSAILININVMFGTGILINTVLLSQRAGLVGFLGYPITALLTLPLILTTAALIEQYPSGGFYEYATSRLGRFYGFVSTWCYIFGKFSSGALMTHVFCQLLQTFIPALASVPIAALDAFFIALITWASLHNLKTGKNISLTFLVLKITPAIFVIMSGIYAFFTYWQPQPTALLWHGIPSTLPLILYTCFGFEICCSISHSIENAKVNAPKAIIYSFLFSVCFSALYQLCFFLATSGELIELPSFLYAFNSLVRHVFSFSDTTTNHLVNVLHMAGAASALGGAFGILMSNHWNIYQLAKNNHLIATNYLTKMNKNNIPTAGVLIGAAIYGGMLLATGAQQVILQQISTLGVSISYMMSVLAFLRIPDNIQLLYSKTIGRCALASTLLFLASCTYSFIVNGIGALYLFAAIVAAGIILFAVTPGRKVPVAHHN